MPEDNQKKRWHEENIEIIKKFFSTRKSPPKEIIAKMPIEQLTNYLELTERVILEIKEEQKRRKIDK